MRPTHVFAVIIVFLIGFDASLYIHVLLQRENVQRPAALINDIVTSGLGLTDLCIATEARYTRHPAVSDSVTPFMDHLGAIEHFPTGSFWVAPRNQ